MLLNKPAGKGNSSVIAQFFKRGNHDLVSITCAGDAGNVAECKVTPALVQQFPREWEAYQNGLDMPTVVGTPLTELPGFPQELERIYKMHQISVVEQLAEASDGTMQKLGMGALNYRKSAKLLLDSKQLERLLRGEQPKGGDPVVEVAESSDDTTPRKRRK